MPSLFTEADYENSVIELFENMGYTHVYGPDIERDFTSPLYDEVLEDSIRRLNPDMPEAAIADALYKLRNFENGELVQKNAVFMDYLQNGIQVSYYDGSEHKAGLVYLADFRHKENNSFIVANQWTFIENSNKRPDWCPLIPVPPHGDLIADAMRVEMDADIALLNTANIRGCFTPGADVDSRLLGDISPFEDKMMLLSLSEKQIVDAIKFGLETSFNNKANKPGILLVSGMKYKANTKGELLSIEYVDRNNVSHPIDVKNPSPDKKYTVATDDFIATGGDNYFPVNPNPDFILKTLDYDKNKMACDYIKKLSQPFDVKYDGRLEIVQA